MYTLTTPLIIYRSALFNVGRDENLTQPTPARLIAIERIIHVARSRMTREARQVSRRRSRDRSRQTLHFDDRCAGFASSAKFLPRGITQIKARRTEAETSATIRLVFAQLSKNNEAGRQKKAPAIKLGGLVLIRMRDTLVRALFRICQRRRVATGGEREETGSISLDLIENRHARNNRAAPVFTVC